MINQFVQADPHKLFSFQDYLRNQNEDIENGPWWIMGLRRFFVDRYNALNLMLDAVYPDPKLYISEFLINNRGITPDEYNEADSWIEIYNKGQSSLNLTGYFLSNDLENPCKWSIPEGVVIEPSQSIVFWMDNQPYQGVTHTGFKANKESGWLCISAPTPNSLHY